MCSYILVSWEADYYYGNNNVKDLLSLCPVGVRMRLSSVEKPKKAMLVLPLRRRKASLIPVCPGPPTDSLVRGFCY